MSSHNSSSAPPSLQNDSCIQECTQLFIQNFKASQTKTTPPKTYVIAVAETNAQASNIDISEEVPSPPSKPAGLNHQFCALPPPPFLSRLCIASRLKLTRSTFAIQRFGSKIREITIGNSSFSVSLDTQSHEDSCYIDYVSSNQCWRAPSTVSPSGVDLRLVEEDELTEGCQQLNIIAGCVFKTAATTPTQHEKPINIPPRCLKKVMHSLGFCTVHTGSFYEVFVSRIGRSIQAVVTMTAVVNQHGESHINGIVFENTALKISVQLLGCESVSKTIHRLKEQSQNSVVITHGLQAVGKKLLGCGSIILM